MNTLQAPTVSALLDLVPGGALVLDGGGAVLWHNAEAAGLLGDALTGQPVDALTGQPVEALLEAPLERLLEASGAVLRLPGGTAVRIRVFPLDEDEAPRYVLHLRPHVGRRTRDRATDRFVQALTEGIRAPLASIRAAIETMTEYPEMEAAVAAQFQEIIREQAVALSRHLEAAVAQYAAETRERVPLELLSGQALLKIAAGAVRQAVEAAVPVEAAPPEDLAWVRVETESLAGALRLLAGLVHNAVRPERFCLRLRQQGRLVALDLVWPGPPIRPERLRRWQEQPLTQPDAPVAPTLEEILDRHGAELWARQDAASGTAYLRLLLPT